MRALFPAALAATLFVVALPAPSRAQAPTILRVKVIDTLGVPVADATLRLLHDTLVAATGRTAPDGTHRFVVNPADTGLELAMQKVGYVATRRGIAPPPGKTTEMDLVVTPFTAILDSVHIVGHRTADDLVPTIDTTEINASGRSLIGLFSLISKLRPREFNTNYRRVRPCLETGTRLYINEQFVLPAQYDALRQFPPDAVLYIQFVECFDRSIDENDHPGARHTYVTLKPGVHYTTSHGLSIDSMATRDVGKMADSGKAIRGARGKLIGIYDEVSGDPLDNVEIKDVATGLSVRTTETGTAALFFARTDATMLGLSKLGYRPMTMLINDPWADTIPLTVTLMPRGVSTVEAKRRSPADTIQKLVTAGFYDRRAWVSAPTQAFLTAADMRGAGSISAAARTAGRPLCESAVYVDGAFTNIGAALLALPEHSRTIDNLFPLSLVAAIETYIGGEIPPQFDRWNESGTTMVDAPNKKLRCVTAIWTN